MNAINLFRSLENPITNQEAIDRVVNAYSNSYFSMYDRGYSNSFYANLISEKNSNKIYGKSTQKDLEEFNLYNFYKWRHSILVTPLSIIQPNYKSAFKKLQEELNKFIPQNAKEATNFLYNLKNENGKIVTRFTDPELANIIEKTRYNRFGEESGWTHISTGYTEFNGKEFKVKHRLYINTNSTFTHKMALLFMKKCDSMHIPYYYKIDEFGDRADTMVIYASNSLLLKYIEILNEIKKENKDLIENNTFKPPFLTAKLDNWIGYGSEPTLKNKNDLFSFNSLRAKMLDEVLTKMLYEWLKRNKDNNISYKGKISSFKEFIANRIFNKKLEELRNKSKRKDINDEMFLRMYGIYKSDVESLGFQSAYKKFIVQEISKILDNIDNLNNYVPGKFKLRNKKEMSFSSLEVNKMIRSQLTLMQLCETEFNKQFIEEVAKNSKRFHIFSENFAYDTVQMYELAEYINKSNNNKEKEEAKPYVYKAMTKDEISASRRKLGF